MANSKWNSGDLLPFQEAISALILNHRNEVLVQDHVKLNKWTIPIGKVDPGDTYEGTLRKEMLEELNIEITSALKIGHTKNTYSRINTTVTIESDVFLILSYGGKIKNNEPTKHKSLKWMSIKQILSLDESKKSDALKFIEDKVIELGG